MRSISLMTFSFTENYILCLKFCAGNKPEERLQNLAFDAIFINQ